MVQKTSVVAMLVIHHSTGFKGTDENQFVGIRILAMLHATY